MSAPPAPEVGIPLARLVERVSANSGRRYMAGRIANGARLLVLPAPPDRDGRPQWDLVIAPYRPPASAA